MRRAHGTAMSNTKTTMIGINIFAALALLPRVAAAQETETQERPPAIPTVAADSPSGIFGERGQLAISSDAGFSLSNTSISDVDGSSTLLVLRPSVDYFVVNYLSVGGFLGVQYASTPGGSSTQVSVGPRVGYNIPLSALFSFWPKLGFSFASTSQEEDDNVSPDGEVILGSDESSTSLQLNIFAPVMFHPVEHFFLGLGPAFESVVCFNSIFRSPEA
jgi:hypothetical protein